VYFRSLDGFKQALKQVFDAGVRLVQLRAVAAHLSEWLNLLECALVLAKTYNASISINCAPDIFLQLQQRFPHDQLGLHLNSHELTLCQMRPVDMGVVVSASCHNLEELQLAEALGVDYLLLSPVQLTASHPDAVPMGWGVFAALVGATKLPVYALGGMSDKDLMFAREQGAQGIAAIGNWWAEA
jgi:8-oxo-dGTP diphosphatase